MHRLLKARAATLTTAFSVLLVASPASAQAPAKQAPTPAAGAATPGQATPKQGATPGQATPKQGAPKQGAPKQGAPKQGAPKQDAPKQDAPDQAKPADQASPPGDGDGTPADQAKPDQGTPDNATPDQGTPDSPEPPFDPNSEPTAEELELARQSFIEGNQFFQAEDYDQAVEKFKLAYRLSRNALLLYNIGFTHDKRKDRELALFYYEKFLTDAGPTARMYDEVKDRVEAIKKAKEADAFFDSGSMGKIDEGEKPRITEFMHKVVEETAPGYPLDITAFVPEASGWQVTLFYRASGEDRFGSTLMKERYNELVGRIPATKTTGKSLQYYIEVRDKQGNIVARSGRSASPNLVFVEKDAKPRYYPDVDSEELDVKPIIVPEEKPEDSMMNLGFMTMEKRTFTWVKWGTTGTAAALLLGGLAANRRAALFSDTLVEQAERSTITDSCPTGTPCRSFSNYQKDLQRTGKRWETLSYVSTGLGVLATGAAGYLWFKELTKKKRSGESSEPTRVTVVPMVGQDFLGSAATLSF